MHDEEKRRRDTADERDNSSGYDAREGMKEVDCYAAVVNDRKGVRWEMMTHARLR